MIQSGKMPGLVRKGATSDQQPFLSCCGGGPFLTVLAQRIHDGDMLSGGMDDEDPVSYTHLDVYKRQAVGLRIADGRPEHPSVNLSVNARYQAAEILVDIGQGIAIRQRRASTIGLTPNRRRRRPLPASACADCHGRSTEGKRRKAVVRWAIRCLAQPPKDCLSCVKTVTNQDRLFAGVTPVSYTHLDVYKRQLQSLSVRTVLEPESLPGRLLLRHRRAERPAGFSRS